MLYVVAPNEVEQMVFDGSCDLGIGFFAAHRQGLEYRPLFTSTMNLYCGREHPLFERAPDDLSLEEVISKTGKTQRRLLGAFIDELTAVHADVDRGCFRIGASI